MSAANSGSLSSSGFASAGGEVILEGILSSIPALRTKSIHAVIIPFARQVSLFYALCNQKQTRQQQYPGEGGGVPPVVSQFLSSGTAVSVANQMLTSVENMCQIVQVMEKNESQSLSSYSAASRRSNSSNCKDSTLLPAVGRIDELCERTLQSARVVCRLMESGSNSCVSVSGGDHLETLVQNVAKESFTVLVNLCHLLNTADSFKVAAVLKTHDKVLCVLRSMESVTNFQEFVQTFGEFGSNMVELAQLSGERQNDLLSDCCSSQLGCSRAVLEKGTMMLLTCSKTLLRHPECNSAQRTRDSVYELVKSTLASFRVSLWGVCAGDVTSHSEDQSQSGLQSCSHTRPASIQQLLTEAQGLLCDCAVSESISQWTYSKLNHLISLMRTQFEHLLSSSSDTATTTTATTAGSTLAIPEEETTHIFNALDQIQLTCHNFSCANANASGVAALTAANTGTGTGQQQQQQDSSLHKFSLSFSAQVDNFVKSVHSTVLNQSAQCLTTQNHTVQSLHLFTQAASARQLHHHHQQQPQVDSCNNSTTATATDYIAAVEAEAAKFQLYAQQHQNLCALLYEVCESNRLRVALDNCRRSIGFFSHQLVLSAQTAALYRESKIASENLTVFIDVWSSHMHSFSTLMNEVVAGITNRVNEQLPPLLATQQQPTLFRTLAPLSYNNVSKVRRLGIEVKRVASMLENEVDFLHSSLDAEGMLGSSQLSPEKSSCTDIMKRCGNLCSMAFALYLYSRKEGPLKSINDLFTQVQFFVEEGSKIHGLINEKSQQLISLAMGGQMQPTISQGQMQGQQTDTSSELKKLFTVIPEKVNSLMLLVSQFESLTPGSFCKVENCFQEVAVVLWDILALVRFYFQAMYLTYLPDYSWPASSYNNQTSAQQSSSLGNVMFPTPSQPAMSHNSLAHAHQQQTSPHNVYLQRPNMNNQQQTPGASNWSAVPANQMAGYANSANTGQSNQFQTGANQRLLQGDEYISHQQQFIAPISVGPSPVAADTLKKTSSLFDRM